MEPQEEEGRWIERALTGDHSAFAQIVERYQTQVYNLAYRMLGTQQDAEDAAQEIFIRVYTRLSSYDRARRFSTWLMSVSSNYCIDRLRRRRPILPIDDLVGVLSSKDPGPERVALLHEEQSEVKRALRRLPDHYRLITVLRYWNDLSYEEICAVTGLSESAVKTRLHRARRMVAEALEEEGFRWNVETSVP
jgi:RNA polymerase sigma-70 factor, ECF subfamily